MQQQGILTISKISSFQYATYCMCFIKTCWPKIIYQKVVLAMETKAIHFHYVIETDSKTRRQKDSFLRFQENLKKNFRVS